MLLYVNRVYDNAQANAVMQKAIQILSIEEGMSKKRKQKFRDYLSDNCNPLVEFYDDDDTEIGDGKDATKVTIQIKVGLEMLYKSFSRLAFKCYMVNIIKTWYMSHL